MTRKTDPRTARLPVPAGELPPFTPVPRQYDRHDGWTPDRQRAFIEALADTGSVDAACKAVNMSQRGAYALRREPGADSFRAAWQAALDLGVQRVEDVVMDRALNGVEELVYSYGKLIGTRTRYNDRLLMFILRNRAPERFGANGPGAKRASGMGGLNAVGQMEAERWKTKWRKEWEAEQSAGDVTAAQVRASIDRKIEAIRRDFEARQAAQWARLSPETHAAWEQFAALRARDLDAMNADEDARALTRTSDERPDGPWSTPQPRKLPPPPEPRKTVWTAKDEDFWGS